MLWVQLISITQMARVQQEIVELTEQPFKAEPLAY
jgi:hypothetical protein